MVNFLSFSGLMSSPIRIFGLKFWSASLLINAFIASSLSAISLASSLRLSSYFSPRSNSRAWISSRDLPSSNAAFNSLSAFFKLDLPKMPLTPSDIFPKSVLSSSCGFLLSSLTWSRALSKLSRAFCLSFSSGLRASASFSVSSESRSKFWSIVCVGILSSLLFSIDGSSTAFSSSITSVIVSLP